MKVENWCPLNVPVSTYDPGLDGLELTLWMIEDFIHLKATTGKIDHGLAAFNNFRRSQIQLPVGWK